jgi:hypothetical protein
MSNRLPIQPIITDEDGTPRFRQNKVVRYLLDHGGLSMDALYDALPGCEEDWEQFAQLIGYTVSGFGDLDYARPETYEAASLMAREGLSERDARLQRLEAVLDGVRRDMKSLVPRLFRIHPDELKAEAQDE